MRRARKVRGSGLGMSRDERVRLIEGRARGGKRMGSSGQTRKGRRYIYVLLYVDGQLVACPGASMPGRIPRSS